MKNKFFPTQVIDDFFEDPKKIVKFAKTLKYYKGPDGNWPGVRSAGLHDVNYKFFNSVLNKIFSLFFCKCKHYFSFIFPLSFFAFSFAIDSIVLLIDS